MPWFGFFLFIPFEIFFMSLFNYKTFYQQISAFEYKKNTGFFEESVQHLHIELRRFEGGKKAVIAWRIAVNDV